MGTYEVTVNVVENENQMDFDNTPSNVETGLQPQLSQESTHHMRLYVGHLREKIHVIPCNNRVKPHIVALFAPSAA
jgi:hypothetical protein